MNEGFIRALNESFAAYLSTGPRSNEKLKVLHGFIAGALQSKLGNEYVIKSFGVNDGKEYKISGRYIDKDTDITIFKDNNPIAGIAVKFVMSNYSQNSNNYFENMLGETANVRCNGILHFNVIILIQDAPYFDNDGIIKKLEKITFANLHKYSILSEDDTSSLLHSPNKTLLCLIKSNNNTANLIGRNKSDYREAHSQGSDFAFSCIPDGVDFGAGVIFNDFDGFLEKIYYRIKSI